MNEVEQRITSYVPLAKSLAKRYPSLPYDDRLQEALLGLTIAANTFDPEKGKFGPYASTVIRNRLNSMLGIQLNEQRTNPTVPFSSLDRPDSEGSESQFSDSLADNGPDPFACLDAALTINSMIAELSPLHRSILKLHLAGKQQKEIAKILRPSQPTISRHFNQLKEAVCAAV